MPKKLIKINLLGNLMKRMCVMRRVFIVSIDKTEVEWITDELKNCRVVGDIQDFSFFIPQWESAQPDTLIVMDNAFEEDTDFLNCVKRLNSEPLRPRIIFFHDRSDQDELLHILSAESVQCITYGDPNISNLEELLFENNSVVVEEEQDPANEEPTNEGTKAFLSESESKNADHESALDSGKVQESGMLKHILASLKHTDKSVENNTPNLDKTEGAETFDENRIEEKTSGSKQEINKVCEQVLDEPDKENFGSIKEDTDQQLIEVTGQTIDLHSQQIDESSIEAAASFELESEEKFTVTVSTENNNFEEAPKSTEAGKLKQFLRITRAENEINSSEGEVSNSRTSPSSKKQGKARKEKKSKLNTNDISISSGIGTMVIGVAGMSGRVGTTNQAIQCAMYLAQKHKKVACFELGQEAVFWKMNHTRQNPFHIEGVDFYPKCTEYLKFIFSNKYDAAILDLGSLMKEGDLTAQVQEYARANIKLLIAGSAEWDIDRLTDTVEQLHENHFLPGTKIIMNLTDDRSFHKIESELLTKKQQKEFGITLHMGSLFPDPMRDVDHALYDTIFEVNNVKKN
ncbi:hypothetical protein [Paenibacillus polymyxa]|uniref:hypothetical protein n=2 Tax=Paenibacillus polymyxa TaxID=1406 RepID=UPI001C9E0A03|nr:hypothetical protein [Paenibacillus polymyxa]MBY7740280.1 hypothetical protein [Paenibacillus polymyxa]